MKPFALAAALFALVLSGCQSEVPDNFKIGLGPREAPQSRTFAADQKATYAAAKAVIGRMGYHVVKGGAAQGELTALSDVAHGDGQGGGRQISLRIKLTPGVDSGTEMEVSLTEILEADSSGQQGLSAQTPLLDTPLYEKIFKDVQQELVAPRVQ